MATDTLQLRTFIENFTILQANKETGIPYPLEKRIEVGRKELFDFDYPFFDENYKPIFERNFIEYFYTREIGFETMGLFKLRLRSWLRLNMPYYNEMWKSTLIEFDPLVNSERTITSTKELEREQIDDTTRDTIDLNKTDIESQSNTKGHSLSDTDSTENADSSTDDTGTSENDRRGNHFTREIDAETPDSRLQLTSNADGSGTVEYASNIKETRGNDSENTKATTTNKRNQNRTTDGNVHDESESTTDTTATQGQTYDGSRNETGNLLSNINDIEDYVYHTVGKIGVQSYSKMMMDFRESLINIELMVFEDMQELFSLIYTF